LIHFSLLAVSFLDKKLPHHLLHELQRHELEKALKDRLNKLPEKILKTTTLYISGIWKKA